VYVLLVRPLTRQWQNVLQREAAQILRYFTDETIVDFSEVRLYRLKPH
jgi:hypothetical protein